MSRQIASDPFSRMVLTRENVNATPGISKGCAWCGGFRVHKRGGRHYLYVYTVSGDGSRSRWESRAVCSKGCAESDSGGPML